MIAHASFEDFLYIIAGIIWIAFSFYNAKKKKQAKKAAPPTSKKKSILESLFDEIGQKSEQKDSTYYEPEQDIYEKSPEVDSEHMPANEPEKVFSYDDFYEEGNYNPIPDVIERKSSSPIKNISTTNYKIKRSSVNKRNKKINLKKAVIYSEILNKPKF